MLAIAAELLWFVIILGPAALGLWVGLKAQRFGVLAAVLGVVVWLGTAFLIIQLSTMIPHMGWRIEAKLR